MKAACLQYITGLLGCAIAVAWCGAADAATLILGASQQSRYDQFGINWLSETASDQFPIGNTLTGWRDGIESRSYFVFDVSAVSDVVTGAKLRLLNKRYYSTLNNEKFELFDVTTPALEVVNELVSEDIFRDLGTGASYGTTTVVADPTTNDFDNVVQEYFEIVLTQAAIDGINQAAAQGKQYFAIGVKLADDSRGSPYVFKCEDLNGVPIPPPFCTLRGVKVEGSVFSGGFRDPLRNSEVPGELVIETRDSDPPVRVPEASAELGLIAFGLTSGVVGSWLRRSN